MRVLLREPWGVHAGTNNQASSSGHRALRAGSMCSQPPACSHAMTCCAACCGLHHAHVTTQCLAMSSCFAALHDAELRVTLRCMLPYSSSPRAYSCAVVCRHVACSTQSNGSFGTNLTDLDAPWHTRSADNRHVFSGVGVRDSA